MTARSVANRIALLSYGAINIAMMAVTKSVSLFSAERPVVARERLQMQYHGADYMMAKVIAEFPMDTFFSLVFGMVLHRRCEPRISQGRFLALLGLATTASGALGLAVGALAPSPDAAVTLATPLMVLMMIVGVKNPAGVQSRALPLPLSLIATISPIRWAIDAMLIAELRGATFEPSQGDSGPKIGALAATRSGSHVLDRLGMANASGGHATKRLVQITIGNLILAALGLAWQCPRGGGGSGA
mmetsp:Transcript_31283/g.90957  ORF Transcript_31283/g.90957 Transcript_31283/m.90957 type:complete len:244 (-) Transcript_31283:272-1003(-)